MSIIGFNSIEDAFEYMGRQEDEANLRTHHRQRAIGYGDYVVRLTPDYVIFGYVYEKAERDKGEDGYTIKLLNDSFSRGYRTGRWYSEVCPEGELGDTHVVSLWPIFKEEFDLAMADEFETHVIVQTEWFQNMLRRCKAEAQSSGRATESDDGAGFTTVEEAL